jgi:threonine dehydrogenase-like Zn-dependent dehydrogenase
VQIQLYQALLKTLIDSGKAKPSFVFDKEYDIKDAAKAYEDFSEHKIIKAVFRFPKHT